MTAAESDLLGDQPPPPSLSRRSLPAIGEVLDGRYRLEAEVARGGMGVVYSGKHLLLRQAVAVKFIRPELIGNEEAVSRFLNEARIAASLRSEHVARVMDVGLLHSGIPFLVMEFLDGVDLQSLLHESGPLGVREIIEYTLQICEALDEAHAARLVHRDIKPENLFLTKDAHGAPRIQVVDFGISKRLDPAVSSLTDPTQSVGSPLYMSPEQMKNPADVDTRTDIWSLGVTMFQLLTGRVPFDGEQMPQVCAKVLSEPAPSPRKFRSDAPEVFSRIILRCLEKDREDRYPSVEGLSSDLIELKRSLGYSDSQRIGRISDAEPTPYSVTGVRGRYVQSSEPSRLGKFVAMAAAALALVAVAVVIGARVGLVKTPSTLRSLGVFAKVNDSLPATTPRATDIFRVGAVAPAYSHARAVRQPAMVMPSEEELAALQAAGYPMPQEQPQNDIDWERVQRLADQIRVKRTTPIRVQKSPTRSTNVASEDEPTISASEF